MTDTELDAMITKLSGWNPQEHPGIRAGKLLEILRELKKLRSFTAPTGYESMVNAIIR